ncbi:recombinase family protein [Bremerella alba]|uniref:Recombinase domain-containing protein n=1 Tax=Bremerella alba TaxID=980252 RepID=A0A7V9A938_9BACT|nr:recombinase family protein [Bremerella alba]MBA2116736.1 hypothetical protein [Bremerella alba]
MRKKKAYSYLRFSSGPQAKGDSKRRQSERPAEWAEANGYELDNSLVLMDEGVSGWTGANATTGKLKAFIDAVDAGSVKKGSALIVENLDRLTRQQVPVALEMFLSILRRGITIVTLSDAHPEIFHWEKLSEVQLIIAIVILSRAHGESERKSQFGKAKWRSRREEMRKGKTVGNLCPRWLKSKEDRSGFIFVRDKVKTVRKIVKLYLDGLGAHLIAEKLNTDGNAPLGHGRQWDAGQIKHVLSHEALIGRKQPMRLEVVDGKRKKVPDGEPIVDYFPAVVDQETWDRLQYELSIRSVNTQPRKQTIRNLFPGSIISIWDNHIHVWKLHSTQNGITSIYCPRPGKSNKKKRYHLPYTAIERAVLLHLRELDASKLTGRTTSQPNQIDAISGKLVQLEQQLTNTEQGLTKAYSDTLARVAQRLEGEIDELQQQLSTLTSEQQNVTTERIKDLQDLIEQLDNKSGDTLISLRRKLKARMQTLVKRLQITQIDEISNQHKHIVLGIVFRGEPRCRILKLEIKQGQLVSSYMLAEAIVERETGEVTLAMIDKNDPDWCSLDKPEILAYIDDQFQKSREEREVEDSHYFSLE